MNRLNPGAIFRHYKNKEYMVMGVALHTETMEELVVYRSLYKTDSTLSNKGIKNYQLWTRPKAMFLETVNIDGKEVPRFEFIEN